MDFAILVIQDVKVLFPLDHSPFYAGFGNRDTDELSYLRVGIPRGKIFTINPKVGLYFQINKNKIKETLASSIFF